MRKSAVFLALVCFLAAGSSSAGAATNNANRNESRNGVACDNTRSKDAARSRATTCGNCLTVAPAAAPTASVRIDATDPSNPVLKFTLTSGGSWGDCPFNPDVAPVYVYQCPTTTWAYGACGVVMSGDTVTNLLNQERAAGSVSDLCSQSATFGSYIVFGMDPYFTGIGYGTYVTFLAPDSAATLVCPG